MLVLCGILVMCVGLVAGLNPLLVVAVAGIVTGVSAGLGPLEILGDFGHAFITSRYVAIIWLVVPVIGMLERAGLREQAQRLIGGIHAATVGRLLIVYLLFRQVTAALGLNAVGGHPQMVRPLIAPMAEAAAEKNGPIDEETRMTIRAHAAAADNVGNFFGEDVFIAVGSILLIKGVLQQNGITAEPVDLALWAIPTAILAFLVHGARLLLLDRRLSRVRESRS